METEEIKKRIEEELKEKVNNIKVLSLNNIGAYLYSAEINSEIRYIIESETGILLVLENYSDACEQWGDYYIIRDREAGNIIEYALSLEEAKAIVNTYEKEDGESVKLIKFFEREVK